jgi:hypothetical protein
MRIEFLSGVRNFLLLRFLRVAASPPEAIPGVHSPLGIVFLLLFASAAWGDIEVKPQYDEHEPIVATVTITDVPEGAKLRGSFAVSDGSYLPSGENVYHIWCPPGKHTLTAAGVWVLTKDVTVGDQTFPVLLDFGQFSYTRQFTVGEDVPPVPPTPVPPPGVRWAVIWEESSQRTPQQAALYVQLRKSFTKNRLLILDVSQLPPAWEAYRKMLPANQDLPALQVLAGDKQVRVVSCPSSVDAVQGAINE